MLKIILFLCATYTILLPTMTIASNEVESDASWWKKTIIYQIYPRSFQDSNGDGVGDLKGIQSRLDYFAYINVDTIWLSPVYTSPMKDFGYDVADHKDIDPVFGTLHDFDDLIEDVHNRGMRLMMDIIPNHSSDLHEWFQASRRSSDNPYSDYYRWSDGKVLANGTRVPPNNWLSIFGGSAWEWDDQRQAYYYHQFLKEQPDLNYRNPKIGEEMKDVFRFWIERGVDGFRVDAIATMFEVEDESLDEPLSGAPGVKSHQHEYLLHPYTTDLAEIHDVTREWRQLFDEYEEETGKHIFMVMEVYDEAYVEAMKYYESGSDLPFNFNLMYMNQSCGGTCTHALVDGWLQHMPAGGWPNYVLGNHDRHRITTRKGPKYANALNMMLLTLPGSPTTYYGEEIALGEITVSFEDTQDPWGINYGRDVYEEFSRDPCRAPMQWNADHNAGFSTADKTWLPVHPEYTTHNVEVQQNAKDGKSALQIYRQAAILRKEPSFQNSHLSYVVVNENIISYLRTDEGLPVYLVTINVGLETSTDDYRVPLYTSGTVVLDSGVTDKTVESGKHIELQSITLKPGDAIVVRLQDESKTEL